MYSSSERCLRWAGCILLLAASACHQPGKGDRVYRIGTDNSFPYHYLDGRGAPNGMTGVLIQEAARRAGVRLVWIVRKEGPYAALAAREVDLWPLLSLRPELRSRIYYTRPYLTNSYVEVATDPDFFTEEGSARVRRVALVALPLVTELAGRKFPHADLVRRRSREDALAAVCAGDADVVFVEARPVQYLALERPERCIGRKLYTFGLDLPLDNCRSLRRGRRPRSQPSCDRRSNG